MKVIKTADGGAAWSANFTCAKPRGCGALLEVTEPDLVIGCPQGYDFLGEANGDERVGFKCAVCNTWHPAQLPEGLVARAFAMRNARRDRS